MGIGKTMGKNLYGFLLPMLFVSLAMGASPTDESPQSGEITIEAERTISSPTASEPDQEKRQTEAPPEPIVSYEVGITKATHFINTGDLNQAQEILAVLIGQYPNNAQPYYLMGVTRKRQGKVEDSERAHLAAIEKDPHFMKAYLDLVSLYEGQGSYSSMLAILARAAAVDPENGRIAFYQGRAYQQLKQDELAAPRFLRAALLEPSRAASAHYYAGRSFYRLGLYQDAEESFQQVIQEAPHSPWAEPAQKYLKRIKKTQPKNGRLFLNGGGQYDDNLFLDPSDPLFVGPTGRKNSDFRVVLYAEGDYGWPLGPSGVIGGGYTLYQSLHQEFTPLNTQSHTPYLYMIHQRGMHKTRVDIQYQYLLLHGSRYLKTSRFRPTYTYTPGSTRSSQLYYQIQPKDFLATPLFPGYVERDGINHQVGLSTRSPFREVPIEMGYLFEWENTEGSDWEFKGHHLTVGVLAVRLPADLRGAFLSQVILKDYSHPHSLSPKGNRRQDHVYTAKLSLSRKVTPRGRLELSTLLMRNDSTLAVFDYKRQIYSLNYGWGF